MPLRLPALDDVRWHTVKANHRSGLEIRELLLAWAQTPSRSAHPGPASPPAILRDALLHQGTRFQGGAEAMPFLVDLALADDVAWRADAVELAAGIGAPVTLSGSFDRSRLEALTAEELWSATDQTLDAYAVMCEQDGHAAWLEQGPKLLPLVRDPNPEVAVTATVAVASLPHVDGLEELLREEHPDARVVWHGFLALASVATRQPLRTTTRVTLRAHLTSPEPVLSAAAAVALASAGEDSDEVFEVLLDAYGAEVILSTSCAFERPLAGWVARAVRPLR